MHIDCNWLAGALALIFSLIAYKGAQFFPNRPHFLFFPHLAPLQIPPSFKLKRALWPRHLKFFAAIFVLLAAFSPQIAWQLPVFRQNLPTEGVALYLVLDRSGSMGDREKGVSKMESLQHFTRAFIEGSVDLSLSARRSDLFGLVAFARQAEILSPLTLDHSYLTSLLNQLQPVSDPADDGTAIGYALFKTANLMLATANYSKPPIEQPTQLTDMPVTDSSVTDSFFTAPYTIKNMVAILVTDGIEALNPLDKDNALRSISLAQACQFAKEQQVRVYMINVEPSLALLQYAQIRQQYEQLMEQTGGKFFLARADSLGAIYREIDQIEKGYFSPRPESKQLEKIALYPYLLALAAMSLFLSFSLEATVCRSVP